MVLVGEGKDRKKMDAAVYVYQGIQWKWMESPGGWLRGLAEGWKGAAQPLRWAGRCPVLSQAAKSRVPRSPKGLPPAKNLEGQAAISMWGAGQTHSVSLPRT